MRWRNAQAPSASGRRGGPRRPRRSSWTRRGRSTATPRARSASWVKVRPTIEAPWRTSRSSLGRPSRRAPSRARASSGRPASSRSPATRQPPSTTSRAPVSRRKRTSWSSRSGLPPAARRIWSSAERRPACRSAPSISASVRCRSSRLAPSSRGCERAGGAIGGRGARPARGAGRAARPARRRSGRALGARRPCSAGPGRRARAGSAKWASSTMIVRGAASEAASTMRRAAVVSSSESRPRFGSTVGHAGVGQVGEAQQLLDAVGRGSAGRCRAPRPGPLDPGLHRGPLLGAAAGPRRPPSTARTIPARGVRGPSAP